MPSTYTTSLRLTKQANGENANTWGTIFNQQFADLIDVAISGATTVALADANYTLTTANGATDEARYAFIKFTGALTASRNITVPTASKIYFLHNSTTGGFNLVIKTAAGAATVTLPPSGRMGVVCDGTEVFPLSNTIASGATINNFTVGYLEVPQNSQSGDYTLILTDSGKHIYHPSADTTNRTWTIPSNSSVAFPTGTAVTFVNDLGAGTVTIQIDTDTLIYAGSGTTGTRTLSPGSVATALKVAATRWIISGTGIS